MVSKFKQQIVLCILSAVGIGNVYAENFSLNDIQFWTGSGSNQAAMVIQWSSPEVFNNTNVSAPVATKTLVWGYRFDGIATGEDMFNTIVAADPRLFAMTSGNTQYGKAVFALGYDLDNDGDYGITDGSTTYTASNFTGGIVTGSYDDPDNFNSTDSSDLYWGGWYGPNWELWHEEGGNGGFTEAPDRGTEPYWTGSFFTGNHGEWAFSEVGMSSLSLKDGSWMGWTVAAGGLDMFDFEGAGTLAWINDKQAPTNYETAVVPEPATMLLVLMGGLFGVLKNRK